jgi:hypothetical protein
MIPPNCNIWNNNSGCQEKRISKNKMGKFGNLGIVVLVRNKQGKRQGTEKGKHHLQLQQCLSQLQI